jgi:putative addiction module killer protein
MGCKLELYETKRGISPFDDWLDTLDAQARYRIQTRLRRVGLGNFGNYKALDEGISEFKLDFSPGFRIYFSPTGPNKILILLAGTKRTQKRDIEKAKAYLEDYKLRGKDHAKK